MIAERVRVVVAGVPRSYQRPLPEGRWLTDKHVARITAVSPRVELIHTTRAELEAGFAPDPGPEALLIEASGDEPYLDEIPASGFATLVTPRLRWVQSCSSGVGHILNLGLLRDDTLLTNAAGVHANALAESVMAGVLLHAKRLIERIDRQRERVWEELHCRELRGATMCVIGTGNIGLATARLARAFGMRVVGVRRNPGPTEHVDECVGPERLREVLASADYVVVACPLTPETTGMLGPDEFAAMKPGAYLLNVSRGRVAQEGALLDALANGTLSGAYLDAHAQEPLPRDHPLWSAPGVTVIPHDSHSSPLIGDNIIDLFADNLARYLSGEPLRNVVDPARGY
ncbi:MAG TPA: D-2-hydroxyacid dehydrogenase [Thermomicrobiales bacterium]|nr:D-2-hydroxyacid dehydrogenase [Thermomicrobiales bacterium]